MNEIVNWFLIAWDKFMPEVHLRQPPSKHFLLFKRSWRRIQHVFSIKNFHLPRRLEGVLQIRLSSVLKTSWRRLGRRKIVMLKTSWRRLEDMSWGRLKDMSWRRLEDMSWIRLEDMSWRCLEDSLEINKMFAGDICI